MSIDKHKGEPHPNRMNGYEQHEVYEYFEQKDREDAKNWTEEDIEEALEDFEIQGSLGI